MNPRIRITALPDRPRAVVLVLHGGDGDATAPVRQWQPAVARVRPLAVHIARRDRRIAVLRLINRARGLGERPLLDVEWALSRIERRFPSAPVWLVGHSLGGSVSLGAAGWRTVTGVVALSPWLSGEEDVDRLAGRKVLLVHGARDTVTDPGLSRDYVRRAQGRGAAASLVIVADGRHGMLHRSGVFHRLCSGFIGASTDGGAGTLRGHDEHLAAHLWGIPGVSEV